MLSYVLSDTLPGTDHFASSEHGPGVAVLPSRPNPDTVRLVLSDIAAARDHADIVIVSYHWGVEKSIHPTANQRWLARRTIDCGADIVYGHHPHCLQGIELYQGKPILYSLGNFAFPSTNDLCRRTGVVWIRYTSAGDCRVTFQPSYINNGRPGMTNRVQLSCATSHMYYCCRTLGTPVQLVYKNGVPCVTLRSPTNSDPPGSGRSLAGVLDDSCDFVDVAVAVPGVYVDLRYASDNNRFGTALYDSSRCFLRKGTAVKLANAHRMLAERGLSLKVWDGYRPLTAQRRLWAKLQDRRYIADPTSGSDHNRGAAVDVTLVGPDGRDLAMPTEFDDFSYRAAGGGKSADHERRHNALLLYETMTKCGFTRLDTEWWHFKDTDASRYPHADLSLAELASTVPGPE